MAERFALFSGYAYYPQGGWDDLVMIGTFDECKANVSMAGGVYDNEKWAHIVDLAEGKEVCHLVWKPNLDMNPERGDRIEYFGEWAEWDESDT